ncbi:hypothetical protein JXA80_11490 [bacterium]|nr:hypothetical protein [candidate division CSSED10-310 bacterium]
MTERETGIVECRTLVAEKISNDPYREGHPWSISVQQKPWQNRVTVRQGGHGVRPVYFADSENHRFLGTDYQEIVQSCRRLTPNPDGRMELLLLGRCIGMNTLVSEIRRLPPGDYHELNGPHVMSSWIDALEDGGTSTVESVADTFIEGVKQSITFDSTGWLPLSGGLDSRTIAAAVGSIPGVRAYTRGDSQDGESVTATQVARKIGLSHRAYPIEDNYIQTFSIPIVRMTAGMVSFDHGHAIYPISKLKKSSTGIVMPGINGEYGRAFWRKSIPPDSRPAVETMGETLFGIESLMRKNRYLDLLTPDGHRQIDRIRADYISEYVEAAQSARFDHPTAWNDEFYLRHRVRSFTAFGAVIWGSCFSLELPFLNSDYILAMRSLPPSERQAAIVHAEIIRRCAPELNRIRLHPSGQMIQPSPYDHLRRTLNRVIRRLHPSKHTRSHHDYAGWMRNERRFVEPLIKRSVESACGLVHETEVQRLWREHLAGKDHHRILARLITLAVFDSVFPRGREPDEDCRNHIDR